MVEFPRRFYHKLFSAPMSCALELLDLNEKEIEAIRKQPIQNIQGDILASDEKLTNFLKRFDGA